MKALYIRTAKTGSSSIVRWGQNYFSYTHNQETLDSENNKTTLNHHFNQSSFLFYSVRNPYERAISCWQQALSSGWVKEKTSFALNAAKAYSYQSTRTDHLAVNAVLVSLKRNS